MRIGIMGGTFNPIHNGHLLIAENAYHQFELDKVLFMPAGIPPHKQNQGILDGEIRCSLVEAAISDISYFELDEREVNCNEISYTYRTLAKMKEEHPADDFFFIMGADSLLYFDKWVKPDEILRYATVLVAVRDSVDVTMLKNKMNSITAELGGTMGFITTPEFDVSSKEIRNRISKSNSIRFLVPEMVRRNILDNNLYKS